MESKKEPIYCPHCGKQDTWKQDNAFRPFCCERCKLIDLGAWANETHRIPGEDAHLPTTNDESGEID